MTSLPRYTSQLRLPPYSYVPGLSPHPLSDPRGHSFGQHEPGLKPLDEVTWRDNETYCYAIDLFNHGFYWESHEAWEALWHAAGRTGRTADFLKGLIKLAAAGVKLREARPAGVRQHAARAADLLRAVVQGNADATQIAFGLPVAGLIQGAYRIADQATELTLDRTADASRRLELVLELSFPAAEH